MCVERFANSVPGFLSAFLFSPQAPPQSLSDVFSEHLEFEPGQWLWLHLNLTDQRCSRWLVRNLAVPESLATEFTAPSPRHYLRETTNGWVGQVPAYRRDDKGEPADTAAFSMLVTNKGIITGRTKPLHAPEVLRNDLRHGDHVAEPHDLFAALLRIFVETTEQFHNRLLDELEFIEDRVLDEKSGQERQRLMITRRDSAATHRQVRLLRRVLLQASRGHNNLPPAFDAIVQQLTNLDTDFDNLEQRARFFHDEIDAKLAAETNRQLYLLSLVTAAFLPPSLVAGLFGMNVQGIPFSESAHGFWAALTAGVASAVAVGLVIAFANRRT